MDGGVKKTVTSFENGRGCRSRCHGLSELCRHWSGAGEVRSNMDWSHPVSRAFFCLLLDPPGGRVLPIWPIRGFSAGQGMVFVLSVLNRVYNFVQVYPKQGAWFVWVCSNYKQGSCPKQGTKIEGVVLNRVCILGILCSKQGQGFNPSAAHLCPNWLVEYPPPPPGFLIEDEKRRLCFDPVRKPLTSLQSKLLD